MTAWCWDSVFEGRGTLVGQQVNEGNGINTQGVERPRDESRDAESLEAC